MEFTEVLIKFKKERARFKKIPLNVTVSSDRLKIFDDEMTRKSSFYDLLSRSERLDFLLYTLEGFMRNNEGFNLDPITYSKGEKLDTNLDA